jgi:peptidyl-dipeptidase A
MKTVVSALALAASLSAAPALAQSTPGDVTAWIKSADQAYADQTVAAGRAEWVYETYINEDTEFLTAQEGGKQTKLQVANALAAAKAAQVPGLDKDTQRQLTMFRTQITSPASTQPGAAEEVARLIAEMQGIYGKGKGTLGGQPINGSDIEAAMGTSRNPEELKEMWASWHDNVGRPIKADYEKAAALMNQGAKELGFADTGALWRSNYDMDPDAFAALTEKIWNEVKPLYNQLHS